MGVLHPQLLVVFLLFSWSRLGLAAARLINEAALVPINNDFMFSDIFFMS